MRGKSAIKIVLVHGICHGAWCWYKVVAGLRSMGYTVTAIDLAASGADPRTIPEDVSTFADYSKPLMDLISAAPPDEKLLLVGHSFGGISLALAMETFPEKITAGVFVTASLPDTVYSPAHPLDEHAEKLGAIFRDAELKNVAIPASSEQLTTISFPENFLANLLYNNCSSEDLTLACMLTRPGSFFIEELRKMPAFSEEKYGSMDKVYVVCDEDVLITEEFQRSMIDQQKTKEVVVIKGADHMPMLSKPQDLCRCIASIVNAYVN